MYDPEVSPKLKLAKESSTRGHQYKLFKNRANKTIRLKSFPNRIVNTWNNLPVKVVEAPSLSSFKNRLDSLWENQDIRYDYRASIDVKKQRLYTGTYEDDVTIEDNNPASYDLVEDDVAIED